VNIISVFAGGGGSTNNGIAATSVRFGQPIGLWEDSNGNVFVTDETDCVIWEVPSSNIISVVAGVLGTCSFGSYVDNVVATSGTINPWHAVTDTIGNLYISDFGTSVIRKVSQASNIISTIAGNGVCSTPGTGEIDYL
jgi:hypothetical protein